MKITVINLERSEDRRQEITSQLRDLDLDFVIQPAVDGIELPQEFETLVDWEGSRRDGIHVHMGSVANWISQMEVLRRMVKDGPEVMAVLEDDAVPNTQLPSVLSSLEGMSDQFDIVFLHVGPDRPFVSASELPTGHQLGWLRWSHFGSQGYVITRQAAEVFLSCYPLVRTGIDRALASYWRHNLRTFCIRPPVIGHAEHFQHEKSEKWQAPVVRWQDPLWRFRRGWFRTKEGMAKRIALSRLVMNAYGPIAGFRKMMWPELVVKPCDRPEGRH